MDRRNFLRTTALGSVFLSTSGMYLLGKESINNGEVSLEKGAVKIPIIQDVDVLIMGGATAGVAAAVEVSKSGVSTFLVAEETFLGYDVTSTYRYWPNKEKFEKSDLLNKMFPDNTNPTPLHVKKVLDDVLIDNKVGFLYSSFLYDVLFDNDNKIAGVIIANRSGLQAITSKVVIDTTLNAKVAKMAGAEFNDFKAGDHSFEYFVVGKKAKSEKNITVKEMPDVIKVGEIDYKAFKYTYQAELKEDSLAAVAEIEQVIRDITWEPEQFDSSDVPFYIPNASIVSKAKSNQKSYDLKNVSMDSFIPKGVDRLFVLGAYAELNRTVAEELLELKNYVPTAELVGRHVKSILPDINKSGNVVVAGSNAEIKIDDEVKMTWDFERQSVVKGEIEASVNSLPIIGEYDVLVMGGGTAGAPAAMGAARKGAKTLVIEYLHGLGGIMTMGLIGSYFWGYREGFTKEVDKGTLEIGQGCDREEKRNKGQWVKDWKMEWLRTEIRKAGGEIWYGAIGVGAVMDGNAVKGLVVVTPYGKGVVMAKNIIDSTGSADIAIAAGAKFRYTDKDTVAVQGSGIPPILSGTSYTNTDWTFINDTDVYDIWRSFVGAKVKYHDQYDLGKLLQTRERRRIIGDYEIEVLDVFNKKEYKDTFSRHYSSFDTHGFTIDPFFSLLPPAEGHIGFTADVPFRALLPQGIENIIVTGLGASAHRDCMPVIRMQPCLQNQGYSAGMAAALVAKKGQAIRQLDIKSFQKELVKIGNLPDSVLTAQDTKKPNETEVKTSVDDVVNNFKGLEVLLWNKKVSVPLMQAKVKSDITDEQKVVYARILGTLGYSDGFKYLKNYLDNTEQWDEGWRFTGMGQFGPSMSPLDSIVMAIGETKKTEALGSISTLAKKLTHESELSHFRAVAEACIDINTDACKDIVYNLLQLEGVQGHDTTTIERSREIIISNWTDTSTRNNALREIFLAKALYKCGDKNGLGKSILEKYSKDLRGHYARHASGILAS